MTIRIEADFINRMFSLLADNQLKLPTLPEIALAIQDLLKQEDSSTDDLCHLINQDPVITARLVQIANSPLFLTGAPIPSVDVAIKRLGRNVIQNVVMGMAMEELFKSDNPLINRKLAEVWHHATEVANLAAGYSHHFPHMKTDQAMLAGLIHDIGVLPILSMAEDYPDLLADEARLDHLIAKAHVKIGVAILENWDFPAPMIEAVKYHEDLTYNSGAKASYADLVIVANLMSSENQEKLAATQIADVPAFEQLEMEETIQQLGMKRSDAA